MAGAVTKHSLPSGFEEEFVSPVDDDYYCAICKLPAKEPIQTRLCGHRFCGGCMKENMRRQKDKGKPLTCPVDRQGLDEDKDIFPDNATKRKILSFIIKCPSEGCDWTGELRNKEVHLQSCLFKLISCTNKNCHLNDIRRKDLEQHVTIMCPWRIIKCDYCRRSRPKCQMKGHIGKCSMFPVSCPNICGQSFARKMIRDHTTNDCPLAVISCPYVRMGCKRKVQRRDVELHLQSDMKPHLDLACVKLKETEVKLVDTEEKLNTRVFIWKISEFNKILRQAKSNENIRKESVPFYTEKTESYGYKLKVIIYPNGSGPGKNTHLSVYIVVMKGEYDAILPWPFKKKVKFTLIDQQEGLVEQENVIKQITARNDLECFARPTEHDNAGYGFPRFISHGQIYSRRYIVDDTLFFRVEVGPSSSRL